MNERIKELKQQAGIDFNPDQEGLDLFAELVVRECRQVLVDMIVEGRGDFLTLDIALIEIDDTFGIEE
jgi:hypothetical protein